MRIVIVMEKCLVQAVFADGADCRCAVVDLETEGVDPDRLHLTPHGRECTIDFEDAEHESRYVERVFASEFMPDLPRIVVLKMTTVLADAVASHDNWRNCSDTGEALEAWSKTVDKARHILAEVTGACEAKEESDNG